MSGQPWQHTDTTVYQLTEDGRENLWCAQVQGPVATLEVRKLAAQKMAASQDMAEALKAVVSALDRAESNLRPSQDEVAAIRLQARAALAKAGVA